MRLDMAHGWREMRHWGADARALIAAFDRLREALCELRDLDPILVVHRDALTSAFDALTGTRIMNDKEIRAAKQREIEALIADADALKAAHQILAALTASAYQIPADADASETIAIATASASLRKKLFEKLTPDIVSQARHDLDAIGKLVAATGALIERRKAWSARHDAVEIIYQAVSADLDPAIAPAITAWWHAISSEAAAKDYVAALDSVDAMERILTSLPGAQQAAKVARHQQAIADRFLEKSDAKALQQTLDAAELLFTTLNKLDDGAKKIEDAQAAFEAAAKACTAAFKKQANALENADGGHSIDRHGPDVGEELLKRRVEKGLAADGVLSPTHSSTKFDKIEDWLATRDAAIAKILKDNGVMKTSPPPAVGTSYTGVIEHGKPIDSGFVADKTSAKDEVMKDDAGQPVYELKKGKQRWVRNDKAEPIAEDGTVIAYAGPEKDPKDVHGHPVAADDHAAAVWPSGSKPPVLKVKTYKVYTAHTKVSGLTRTLTTIEWNGSEWKVVQHFPHAEGWDPVLKKYTTPI